MKSIFSNPSHCFHVQFDIWVNFFQNIYFLWYTLINLHCLNRINVTDQVRESITIKIIRMHAYLVRSAIAERGQGFTVYSEITYQMTTYFCWPGDTGKKTRSNTYMYPLMLFFWHYTCYTQLPRISTLFKCFCLLSWIYRVAQ